MRLKNFISVLLFSVFAQLSFAQQNIDRELADQYYSDGEFDKALMYYEKLYNKTEDDFYFNRVVKCLIETEETDRAEKMMKKAVRKGRGGSDLRMELGKLYRNMGKDRKAEKTFDEVLDGLSANRNEIVQIARDFSRMGEYEYALKTYEEGKKHIRGFYAFNYEIAEVYGQMGRHEEMIDMYLELIEVNKGYERNVRNVLNRNIDFEEDHQLVDILRNRLLKKVQNHPDNQVFSEMLIWLYLQQNDFLGAYTQVRALDRRNKEDGNRLMDLASMARSNKEYEVAEKCYAEVAKKGSRNKYYRRAVRNELSVRKEKLDNNYEVDKTQYTELKKDYLKILDEWGESDISAQTARELAEIEAYKLNEINTAITRLEDALNYRGIRESTVAEIKIDLGDYLLINGQVWDASLYYMQAERAFKYDELGDKAKFKAAKVYYYTGNFNYAEAQLDVLKGSTSKLIANDAMYLSSLISNNTIIDTTYKPMELFAKADLLLTQTKYDSALMVLDSIQNQWPFHSLADDIEYLRYQIYYGREDFEKAGNALEVIVKNHPDGLLGDEAVYKLGLLNEEVFNDESRAKELYEKIMMEYPGSLFVVDARKRYRRLRGDKVN